MQIEKAQSQHVPGRWAFPALVVANIFLAIGPWLVRLTDVGPVAAGFWRMALAIPILLILTHRTGTHLTMIPRRFAIAIVIGGLLFAADLASWHYGIRHTKLANATLFGNCSSFIFAIYGFVALKLKPQPAQIAALLLAAAGAALLMGSSYELSPEHLRGDLFATLAGIFYFFYLVVIDRSRQQVAPMPVLTLATIGGAPLLLVMANLLGEQVVPGNWLPIVLLSLGSQVIGQGLLVYAMGYMTPLVVGLGFLLQPVVGAVVGWTVYGERLSPTDSIGAIMVCAALVVIRLPARRLASATVRSEGTTL